MSHNHFGQKHLLPVIGLAIVVTPLFWRGVGGEAFSQTPKDFQNKGNERLNIKDYEGAIREYTKAIELDSSYYFAFLNRGICKYEMADYKAAIEDYNIVIRLKRGFVKSYCNRGLCKHKLGNYKEAIKDYN